MSLSLGPDSAPRSPERDLSATPGEAPGDVAPHHETVSTSFARAFVKGPDAEAAFQDVVGTRGFETAVADLEAGAFGEPRRGAGVSAGQLAAIVRVARDVDDFAASAQKAEPSREVDGPLDWVLGVLQGDFNQDPTLSQTVANTLLTMIPGVDQIADVRDVVANLLQIRENPRGTAAWTGLALTLAGLVPTVGSAAKGAARLALDRRSGTAAFEALRRLGVDEPGRFLADQARTLGDTVARQFDAVVGGIADALGVLGHLSPQLAAAAGDVRSIQRAAPTYLTRAVADVEARLAHVANRTPSRVASPERVSRALADLSPRSFHIAGVGLTLNQNDMRHILTRHHPDFWDGSIATVRQTFFDRRMSATDIQDAVGDVLRQNRDAIGRLSSARGTVSGVVGGLEYQLSYRNGLITQFYPKSPR